MAAAEKSMIGPRADNFPLRFLLGTFAYANREAVALKLVGFAVKRRISVGPPRASTTGARTPLSGPTKVCPPARTATMRRWRA